MANFTDRARSSISLFPMFNVLVSTLGVLLFILVAITALSLGAGKSVKIVPGGGGTGPSHGLQPIYLEWTGTSIVAHPSEQAVAIDRNLSDIKTWDETFAYLDEVLEGSDVAAALEEARLNTSEKYLLLLVRPSGFDSLRSFRGYVDNQDIEMGYEPIDQEWSLRMQ